MLFGRKKNDNVDIEIGEELDELPGGKSTPSTETPTPPPAVAETAPGPLIENPAHFDARMQRIELGLEQVATYLQSLGRMPTGEQEPQPASGPAFYEQLIDQGED